MIFAKEGVEIQKKWDTTYLHTKHDHNDSYITEFNNTQHQSCHFPTLSTALQTPLSFQSESALVLIGQTLPLAFQNTLVSSMLWDYETLQTLE